MSSKEKEFILGILDLQESQPPDTDLKTVWSPCSYICCCELSNFEESKVLIIIVALEVYSVKY